jgi:hypothetical protein
MIDPQRKSLLTSHKVTADCLRELVLHAAGATERAILKIAVGAIEDQLRRLDSLKGKRK